MGEGVNNSVDEQSASDANDPACGERLAVARRAQQITVLEIAKELHLDEPKVRALERNDFDVLGAPVFAKGHMRKYAQLVNVNIDDVMADYYRLTRSSGMPPVVLERKKIAQELSPGPWIAAIIVILAAILAYWLIANRGALFSDASSESAAPESQSAAPVQEETVDDLVDNLEDDEEPGLLAGKSGSDRPSGDAASTDLPAVSVATPSTVLQETAGQEAIIDEPLRLALSFSGECWTEISDADGRRLFFNMGRSGRNVNLSGKAPISVLLGNVENVSMKVNGRDYTVSAADRRGRTARLQILSP